MDSDANAIYSTEEKHDASVYIRKASVYELYTKWFMMLKWGSISTVQLNKFIQVDVGRI